MAARRRGSRGAAGGRVQRRRAGRARRVFTVRRNAAALANAPELPICANRPRNRVVTLMRAARAATVRREPNDPTPTRDAHDTDRPRRRGRHGARVHRTRIRRLHRRRDARRAFAAPARRVRSGHGRAPLARARRRCARRRRRRRERTARIRRAGMERTAAGRARADPAEARRRARSARRGARAARNAEPGQVDSRVARRRGRRDDRIRPLHGGLGDEDHRADARRVDSVSARRALHRVRARSRWASSPRSCRGIFR